MPRVDRLPAIPLIASDPYLSIWMPADRMTQADSRHWAGQAKPIRGLMTVDGERCRFLGLSDFLEAEMTELCVSPTSTRFVSAFNGVAFETRFTTPALPDDPDLMSKPVTLLTLTPQAIDGKKHKIHIELNISDAICYNGDARPEMMSAAFPLEGTPLALCGQKTQKPLCHSGDHTAIDWGYLYLLGEGAQVCDGGLKLSLDCECGKTFRAVIAYDDIASINYFGDLCKAWYRRGGKTIMDALRETSADFDRILSRCDQMDERIIADARKSGGEDYVPIACAAWRHTLAAHKLIADAEGNLVCLSKENDSNGCIGTVDLAYPSSPLFLRYAPDLVSAMCRPVLKFAALPVWEWNFAPHDVGRYPYATGQVYAAKELQSGFTYPPYYLYPAGTDAYNPRWQMPVEESGNMLILLASARYFGGKDNLTDQYADTLQKWVQYLLEYGEDPGEQLCTDDFAGHLAHNVNLAFKAVVGVACYGYLKGDESYNQKAKEMAARLLARVGDKGNAPLTLDGQGWSMKYNLLWDKVLHLDLMPESFYRSETESYLPRMNKYGLPLDSRADYTKSDWYCWVAALSDDLSTRERLLAPLARYLRETPSRVAFSDWYDTKTGAFVQFIGRSAQGGVYAPMLRL